MEHDASQPNVETVWWLNAPERLDKINRIKQWLFKIASSGQSRRHSNKIPYSTVIPVSEIDSLQDEQLKSSLLAQRENVANQDSFMTIPVATASTREFKHAWSVRVERPSHDKATESQ